MELFRGKQDAGAERFFVVLFRSEALFILRTRVASGDEVCARFQSETRIAGCVDKEFGANAVKVFGFIASHHRLGDFAVLFVCPV